MYTKFKKIRPKENDGFFIFTSPFLPLLISFKRLKFEKRGERPLIINIIKCVCQVSKKPTKKKPFFIFTFSPF